jgi:hypothetical protein
LGLGADFWASRCSVAMETLIELDSAEKNGRITSGGRVWGLKNIWRQRWRCSGMF